MSNYANYADFIAKIRSQLDFNQGGRPTNFQLHHIIPKEVLAPLFQPLGPNGLPWTRENLRAAKLVAIAMLDDTPNAGFRFNDRNVNGQLLPSTSALAQGMSLTQHNGSHPSYTSSVIWMLTDNLAKGGNPGLASLLDNQAQFETLFSAPASSKGVILSTADFVREIRDQAQYQLITPDVSRRLILNLSDPEAVRLGITTREALDLLNLQRSGRLNGAEDSIIGSWRSIYAGNSSGEYLGLDLRDPRLQLNGTSLANSPFAAGRNGIFKALGAGGVVLDRLALFSNPVGYFAEEAAGSSLAALLRGAGIGAGTAARVGSGFAGALFMIFEPTELADGTLKTSSQLLAARFDNDLARKLFLDPFNAPVQWEYDTSGNVLAFRVRNADGSFGVRQDINDFKNLRSIEGANDDFPTFINEVNRQRVLGLAGGGGLSGVVSDATANPAFRIVRERTTNPDGTVSDTITIYERRSPKLVGASSNEDGILEERQVSRRS